MDDTKQKLQNQLAGLKMELTFSDTCGNHLVCSYIAQKEAGETPTIDISAINTERNAIITKMDEIEEEIEEIEEEEKKKNTSSAEVSEDTEK